MVGAFSTPYEVRRPLPARVACQSNSNPPLISPPSSHPSPSPISGHQLHFDSDETRTQAGQPPSHPLVSCILYITDEVGGPTLVTDQVEGQTYTHTLIHSYTYTYIHTYTHTHIHTYRHKDIHTYTHADIQKHTHIHTYTHTLIQTYRHTDIHTYRHP